VPRGIVVSALVAGLSSSGCVLAPIDLANRPCPCGTGWVCTRDGICVEEGFDAGDDPPVVPDAGAPLDALAPHGGCEVAFPEALFCDDFEFAYGTERGVWGWDQLRDGTLETTEDPPARIGRRSLRAAITAPDGEAALGVTFAPAVLEGDLWVRGYFLVPGEIDIDVLSLFYVASGDLSTGISFQLHAGGQVAAWIGTSEPAGHWIGSTAPIPRDRWGCLQLHIALDNGDGSVELFVDDVAVATQSGIDTVPVVLGGYATLLTGIDYSGAGQGAGVVHADEIVVSRTRVPCAARL
jgi:hypothetical protein